MEEVDLSDPVFDHMQMPDIADRRKFLEICHKSFDHETREVDFYDWKVFISLLLEFLLESRMEGLNHLSREIECISWKQTYTDEQGRRYCLKLSPPCIRGQHYSNSELPAGIQRLDQVMTLNLPDFAYLDLEMISLLTKLHTLKIEGPVIGKRSGLLSSVKLPQVKELYLEGCPGSCEMLSSCVALEKLHLTLSRQSQVDPMLGILCSGDFCFAETLKLLEFCGSDGVFGVFGDYDGDYVEMKSHHNAMLLLQIVPRFPNLFQLSFHIAIDATSLKDHVNQIRSGNSCIISKSLRNVEMCIDWHLEQKSQFLLTLLETFHTIDSIIIYNYAVCNHNDCLDEQDSDLKYALSANMAGRRILGGCGIAGDEDGDSSIPLSVWPVVLARAQRKIDRAFCGNNCREDPIICRRRFRATGLYYLLREGPALMGRRDQVEQPSNENKDECPSKRQRYR